jgi:hypothetical protein
VHVAGVGAANLPKQGAKPGAAGGGGGISPGDQWCVAGAGGAELGRKQRGFIVAGGGWGGR